jgi:hypothetical protein
MARRIAARVPAGRELVVGDYDSVLHLAVDRPLRVLADLRTLEPGTAATALVASETAGGPEWKELDRFEIGSRRLRLLRREPSSSGRAP